MEVAAVPRRETAALLQGCVISVLFTIMCGLVPGGVGVGGQGGCGRRAGGAQVVVNIPLQR